LNVRLQAAQYTAELTRPDEDRLRDQLWRQLSLCRVMEKFRMSTTKQVSEKKREQLYEQILKEAVSYGVGIVDAKRIDEINILQATYEAMREAVSQLTLPLGHVLADAVRIPKLTVTQTPIIKGDAKCYSIAAASIIAKVTRDRIMREYDRIYPGYGFSDNKGYGSAAHIETLKKKGPVPIHRRTFISAFWQGEQD